jgi:hypothetical protein
LKSLTRRELLFEVFTKDTLKSIGGAYKEYLKASDTQKTLTCDEAARMLGKNAKKYTKKFFQQKRKEG